MRTKGSVAHQILKNRDVWREYESGSGVRMMRPHAPTTSTSLSACAASAASCSE